MSDHSRPLDSGARASHLGRSGPTGGDRIARMLAVGVAATFLLVGVLGFVPGITTHHHQLGFAGHHSEAELLGTFQVSVLHNIVHLLFGVVGLLLARRGSTAVAYLVAGGAVYLALAAYGFVIDQHGDANVVPVNAADNWLHLALGVAMIGLGLLAQRQLRGGVGSQSPM